MIGTVITYKTKFGTLYQGHVLDILKELPNESVDCIITSPPYWSLRDYGKQTNVIWGGNSNCKHEWVLHNDKKSAFCGKCGAWYGQLGLEPTLDLYIEHLIWIMKELKRVLKKTGIIFWNHGDCYSSSGKGRGSIDPKYPSARDTRNDIRPNRFKIDIPQKCMCLQNYRFILRCIDELGLILRNIIIWYKPNHMPSSVKDRFSSAYEPVFMLVKSKKVFFDLDAIRIPHKITIEEAEKKRNKNFGKFKGDNSTYVERVLKSVVEGGNLLNPLGKNIKASCPQWICRACGKPRIRITEVKYVTTGSQKGIKQQTAGFRVNRPYEVRKEASHRTIGWTDCGCNAGWESGIVLDPFMGSGTVAVVAEKLNRKWIGIELNEEYCEITKKRLKRTIPKLLL